MSSETTLQRWNVYTYAYGVDGPTVKEQPNGAWVKYEDIAQTLQSARLQGHREGMEEAAKWHDAEAERIRLLALEPTAESVYRMHEAQDDHISHAIAIRELAAASSPQGQAK